MAVPPGVLARASLRLLRRRLRLPWRAELLSPAERRAAAEALGNAPRLFSSEPLEAAYQRLFPRALPRYRWRAERILDGVVEVFGQPCRVGRSIDWHRDPRPAPRGDLDPKWIWELARGGHLVELAAAGRLCPRLAPAAHREVQRQIEGFLAQVAVGEGLHYRSSLEVALRDLHWLGAVELCGGASSFPAAFAERMAAALLTDLRFLVEHLEDGGVAPANHLLGELVALVVLGEALDGAPGARGLARRGRAWLAHEARRQVGLDGAHFEGSTAYHRFALELLLTAHRSAQVRGRELQLEPVLRRMLRFVRGYLTPEGEDPGFGDGDDARVLPVVPRPPREHAYLLPLGLSLFGDPELRAPGLPFAEEALWWQGPAAYEVWRRAAPTSGARSATFLDGGLHVLRGGGTYVALRCGPYGQEGVGGHAHNDQLALVIHAQGRPLVVDPGTGGYSGDLLLRDRFRGTAAHSTVVVEGEEQSPFVPGRPFALPDQARATGVRLEDLGTVACLVGEHRGYERLPCQLRHRRRLTFFRDEGVILVEDHLLGRGEAAVEVRFQLLDPVRPAQRWPAGISAAARARIGRAVEPEYAMELGDPARALLVPLGPASLLARIEPGEIAPRYGSVERSTLVSLSGRLSLPSTHSVAIVLLQGR